jgi:hypothetical protein
MQGDGAAFLGPICAKAPLLSPPRMQYNMRPNGFAAGPSFAVAGAKRDCLFTVSNTQLMNHVTRKLPHAKRDEPHPPLRSMLLIYMPLNAAFIMLGAIHKPSIRPKEQNEDLHEFERQLSPSSSACANGVKGSDEANCPSPVHPLKAWIGPARESQTPLVIGSGLPPAAKTISSCPPAQSRAHC